MKSDYKRCVIVRKPGLVFSELEAAMDLHGLPTGAGVSWGGEDALLYTDADLDIQGELEPYYDLAYDALYIDNQQSVWQYDLFGQASPSLRRIGVLKESALPPQRPDDVLVSGKYRFVIQRV